MSQPGILGSGGLWTGRWGQQGGISITTLLPRGGCKSKVGACELSSYFLSYRYFSMFPATFSRSQPHKSAQPLLEAARSFSSSDAPQAGAAGVGDMVCMTVPQIPRLPKLREARSPLLELLWCLMLGLSSCCAAGLPHLSFSKTSGHIINLRHQLLCLTLLHRKVQEFFVEGELPAGSVIAKAFGDPADKPGGDELGVSPCFQIYRCVFSESYSSAQK